MKLPVTATSNPTTQRNRVDKQPLAALPLPVATRSLPSCRRMSLAPEIQCDLSVVAAATRYAAWLVLALSSDPQPACGALCAARGRSSVDL